ncbi:SufE family protein [Labrys sp. LIt4]|uniref:Cysteine desulfuration protein SufE n=1 Tax=Labrys okinawensis TaxID=346911 RepID=A0A2S9QFE3_9HYPH|nr:MULTISPECIES: SufE family protein [Labrys]MBP0578266.1 SufE family protein [Labrys sp. LIt4]PRH88067.1 cysteine desulfuration protein SufE [Labrys okinawensis]
MSTQDIAAIIENFEILDDWEDRYRYLIELGKTLEPLPDEARTTANKVQGCVSQVWLVTHWKEGHASFQCDSDAFIVRGLLAILVAVYSGHTASEILAIDALDVFRNLQLEEHLTPQRSNGLKSFVERIRSDARQVLVTT